MDTAKTYSSITEIFHNCTPCQLSWPSWAQIRVFGKITCFLCVRTVASIQRETDTGSGLVMLDNYRRLLGMLLLLLLGMFLMSCATLPPLSYLLVDRVAQQRHLLAKELPRLVGFLDGEVGAATSRAHERLDHLRLLLEHLEQTTA